MKKSKPNTGSERAFLKIREYKQANVGLAALRKYGAHSSGIGYKVSKGKETKKPSLKFYVTAKLDTATLSKGQIIPTKISFFSSAEDKNVSFSTDVVVLPAARNNAVDPNTKIRPVPGGVSGGPVFLGATALPGGTFGGWASDKTDGAFVLITNSHVVGDYAALLPPASVVQPSITDGGTTDDIIGGVKRVIPREPVEAINTVDCAIIEPNGLDTVQLQVLEIGPAIYEIDNASINMEVEKFGQASLHTTGRVLDINWSGVIFDGALKQFFYFEDCILIEEAGAGTVWSENGDSGSIVFAQSSASPKPAVGLHFASMSSQCGVACKIHNVFHQLDLEPVCSGGFSMFMDQLFEDEITTQSLPSSPGENGDPARPIRNLTSGMSRDVQKRLNTSKSGRMITSFVDKHRNELLELLLFDNDIKRLTVTALRPLLVGAITTTDVFERPVSRADLDRIHRLSREVSKKSSPGLRIALKVISALAERAEGKTLSKVLKVKV